MKVNPFFKTLLALCLLILLAILYFIEPFYVIVSLLVVLIIVYRNKKKSHSQPEVKPELADFFVKYGNPDEQIVTDPTRGNDIDGAVLYFSCLELLVMNGKEIYKSDITGMTLKNIENPYLPCDYEIRVETKRDDCPYLCISVGADIHWATDVLKQLQQIVEKR